MRREKEGVNHHAAATTARLILQKREGKKTASFLFKTKYQNWGLTGNFDPSFTGKPARPAFYSSSSPPRPAAWRVHLGS